MKTLLDLSPGLQENESGRSPRLQGRFPKSDSECSPAWVLWGLQSALGHLEKRHARTHPGPGHARCPVPLKHSLPDVRARGNGASQQLSKEPEQ